MEKPQNLLEKFIALTTTAKEPPKMAPAPDVRPAVSLDDRSKEDKKEGEGEDMYSVKNFSI